jgi:hypothetical protein
MKETIILSTQEMQRLQVLGQVVTVTCPRSMDHLCSGILKLGRRTQKLVQPKV